MIKRHIRTWSAVFLLIAGMSCAAQAAVLGGELATSLVYEWDAAEKTLEQSAFPLEFRLVLEDYLETGSRLHFSTKGSWDWKNKEGDLFVDQLWLSGYSGDFDYVWGRQLLSWGTADGFNPTNYFARMSSSALISGEMGTDPLWAGQATYYGSNWSWTGVVLPFFQAQEIDAFMREIMVETDPLACSLLKAIEETKKPGGLGKDSEFALRGETNLAGWDLQASFFSGFESLPGLQIKFDPTAAPLPLRFEGKYRRQRFLGLAAAGTIGEAGVWGEVSYGGPVPFAESDHPLEAILSINENYLQMTLGADYTFPWGRGLLAQGQYIYRGQGSLLAPYAQKIEAAQYLYGRFAYDFSPDDALELVVIHGLKDQSGLLLPLYTHRFPRSLSLQVGLLGVYGGEGKEFGPIPSQARIGLSFKF